MKQSNFLLIFCGNKTLLISPDKILICFSAIINQIDRWKESDDSRSDNQVVALLDSLLFINQFCQTRVENFKTPIIFWVYDTLFP